jgi:hypothetical protein
VHLRSYPWASAAGTEAAFERANRALLAAAHRQQQSET